jgi:hypothetical protein
MKMKTKLGDVSVGAYSSKEGAWEELQSFLNENEIKVTSEMEKNFQEFLFIGYEVILNVTIYDDGTFEVTDIDYGGKTYKKGK